MLSPDPILMAVAKRVLSITGLRYSYEDLQQEALAIGVAAARTYDPSQGGIAAYTGLAIYRGLAEYHWRNISPVHASRNDRVCLWRVRKLPLYDLPSLVPDSDELVLWRDWIYRVDSELSRVFSSIEHGEVARAVLLEERRPGEVATDLGISPCTVYRAVSRAKKLIGANRKLKKLWKELSEEN